MKKQTMSMTQVNLLLGRMENEAMTAWNAEYERRVEVVTKQREQLLIDTRNKLDARLKAAKFTPAERKWVVKEVIPENSWGYNAPDSLRVPSSGELNKKDPILKHDKYYVENKRRFAPVDHPIYKLLQDMKFKLVMGSADQYESYLSEFTKQVESLLKSK